LKDKNAEENTIDAKAEVVNRKTKSKVKPMTAKQIREESIGKVNDIAQVFNAESSYTQPRKASIGMILFVIFIPFIAGFYVYFKRPFAQEHSNNIAIIYCVFMTIMSIINTINL
jgi:hypothetical protein